MTNRQGNRQLLPVIALLGVTAVWGSTFFLIKGLLLEVSAMSFLGVRFPLAAVLMSAVFFPRLRQVTAAVWRHGLILGAVYAAAQIAQTWGLGHCDAAVSGFITGMYVVITPVVIWLALRRALPASTWLAVALATVGLAVLSLRGFALGIGETVTLLGAVLYAVHIVLLGRWAQDTDPFALTTIQMIAIAVLCLLGALPGGIVLPSSVEGWAATLYLVVVAGIGALLAQTWAQARIVPERAAIIMTTEPVFAAAFAIALGGEVVTMRLLVGGVCVLAAMQIAERSPRRSEKEAVLPGACT